jgi:hypothetical protein
VSQSKSDKPISLHPLTTAQALSAALRVKPADLKRLEDEEKSKLAAKKAKRRD